MTIANCTVARILVDNGSSVDILYYDAFEKMQLNPEMLKRVESPLYGFNGAPVHVEGSIKLLVTVGTEPKLSTVMMNFLVVKVNSTYNGILGQPGLNNLSELAEDLIPVEIVEGDGSCTVPIGVGLKGERKKSLINFLRNNADVFTWSAIDMPGVDRELAEHRLSIYPTSKPVFQKKRTFAPEPQEKVIKEVIKLLEAGFIEEAMYPEWLSNVVMVPKPNGKWRHEMLSFMDACSEIKMYEPNILKASFIAGRDTYCYTRMPFGLKMLVPPINAARKLSPYFQAYTIEVVTIQPLKKIMAKPDHSGRMVAWSVELGKFDVQYKPCTAIKA
ncbi:uncharacterized protein LOC122638867 [Telopea speciosissima]|uniref:uncharacterized protein LOC122638867 n=1 Tax=Telopea speciosissima TaxID=54955 RepID=UPI001CC5E838|nr:uncharacterized protein LOC122638867 [Telopea speciosissima]